jgi:signal transduction histidine kinase
MTLRNRFIILILGAILIPLGVMVSLLLSLSGYLWATDPAWVTLNFHSKMETMEKADDFSQLTEGLNENYFAMMVEEPELIATSREDISILNDYPRSGQNEIWIMLSSGVKEFQDGTEALIIFGVSIFKIKKRFVPLLFLVVSAIALIVLSLLTIRSINRSIAGLEETTGKIAEGDLNVDIDTSGTDKFGSLAKSLDTMRNQIKAEYDRRNRFFMGVSHDLKTPLAAITGYADALTEGMANDKFTIEKYLNIIKGKSHQLEERITHLIYYLKLSNYDFQASLTESSLKDFLTDFAEVYSEEAQFRGREFLWDISLSSEHSIYFDKDLLTRALENLIQNAYRYGDSEAPIRMNCHKNYELIEIVIENSGKQIPEDQLELVFEPFYRADKSRKGEGFGLGLASVKSIIDSHGWAIDVKSSNNVTQFRISILSHNKPSS